MRDLIIDMADFGGVVSAGDEVVLSAPAVRGSSVDLERIVTPQPRALELVAGVVTVPVEVGPLQVTLKPQGGVLPGTTFKTVVPEGEGPITLRDCLESQFRYDPPVVSAVQRSADLSAMAERGAVVAQGRSEAAAQRAETGAAIVGDAQTVLTARDQAVQASEETEVSRQEVALNRTHVDGQVAAIDTAFTESVPTYLQPDSPSGLNATYVSPAPDVTVTVGPGGEYDTINAALAVLSRRLPTHKATNPSRGGGLSMVVLLKSGFVMAEQVFVHRLDLGWITIRAEDRPVPISRAAISAVDFQGTQPVFYGHQGATLPVIDCLFDMDKSGTSANQSGITLDGASNATVAKGTAVTRNGIINVTYRGVNVHEGSRISIVFGDFSGAGKIGVRIANSSLCEAAYAKMTGCGEAGTSVGGAHANFDAADLSDNKIGIRAAGGSTVSAGSGTNVSGSEIGLYATSAATISAPGIVANNCTTRGAHALNGGLIDISGGDVSNAGSSGLHATSSGTISAKGVLANDCTATGALADFGGHVDFSNGHAHRCFTGISAQSGGKITAPSSSVTGCSLMGAHISNGAWADLTDADLTGAGTNGLRSRTGSFVNAQRAKTRRGDSDSPQDTVVLEGSTINAHGLVGGMSQVKNVVTSSGVIYQA